VNNAFYRLPERATFETWAARTPADFTFAVKASRFLTHIKRLREPAEPVARLVDRLRGLGDKLGPVLLQLPPTLRSAPDVLDETLSHFPPDIRVAVELRHPSWFVDATATVLANHGAAFCLADSQGRRTPEWRTADWGYLRFHAGRATPAPCYGATALHSWADRLSNLFDGQEEVYVYFNNDPHGCAPRNAATFERLIARRSSGAQHRQPGRVE
jgi:uncharacterized protein YecE (DUF72 family)